MSRAPRDAYHAARLLQNELARIASKRERQIGKANGEFQLELIQAVSGADRSALKLVRQVLREDASQMHLSGALATVLDSGAANDDRTERDTEPPPVFELRRPAPLPSTARVLSPAEHAGIGAGGGDDDPLDDPLDGMLGELDGPAVIDAEFDDPGVDGPPTGYRYPEPGEPAIELPDGTIVADPSGAQA